MSIVSIRSMSVAYDSYTALEGVSLDVFSNDFLGIIGPNGGGKTTLIKSILGLVPYSGEILFGESLADSGTRSIGYLPQQNNFDKTFPISVREVVVSGLQSKKKRLTKYTKDDFIQADSIIEQIGIGGLSKKPIGELSGGEMQRALLCRALISDPKLLILDEPTSFVDNKFEKELYLILKKLNERIAIIMVSHDLGTISSVVKSIVCVNKHVHRHNSNIITAEQLHNYDCPIQLISHGHVPHTILKEH